MRSIATGYLCKLFSRIRSKIKRDGIDYFGLRVVEPHHDGTPHWHMLFFVRPEHLDSLTDIIRDYALAEDGHEPGAQKHRFTVELIDWNKGSAVG